MKFTGKVTHGIDIGQKFGIATANLEVENLPKELKDGVFFVHVFWRDQKLNGILHHGKRKTFGGKISTEVHILNFNQQIYNEELQIEVLKFLRPTEKFQNADALFTQVENDVIKAEKFFTRQMITEKWETITPEKRKEMGQKAMEKIGKLTNFQKAQNICVFAPTDYEIPFVKKLCEKFPEKTYFFPKIEEGKMEFFEAVYGQLTTGKFNILEPTSDTKFDLNTIDLIFVPAVAMDTEGTRLGRGGGFYDQFLSKIATPTICVLPKFAVLPEIPKEPHDIKISKVITFDL